MPLPTYLANPTRSSLPAMAEGWIGAIMSAEQGNPLPPGALYAIDNNCGPARNAEPGSKYPGDEAYLDYIRRVRWDQSGDDYTDPDLDHCLFATAPDVLGDAKATLDRARTTGMLGWIRDACVPAALVAQDGLELLDVPWDDFDVLFLGGSTEWKLGQAARDLTAQARERGKGVHMGRVNSWKRYTYAASIGCTSVDGTFLVFGPDKNLPKLIGWIQRQATEPALF